MFDLVESEGVSESERVLTQLCRKSFLRLWSQTNVFTDEGFKGGKGATKELCDALVVFGHDIIVFSDEYGKRAGITSPRRCVDYAVTLGRQRCGNNSSIRAAGCVGSLVSTSLM